MKYFVALASVFLLILTLANFSFVAPVENIKTKAQPGKKLFSEKILSKDSGIRCAGCHKP